MKKKTALIIANLCHRKTNFTQHLSVVWIEEKQKVKQNIPVCEGLKSSQNIYKYNFKNFEEKHALKIFYRKNLILELHILISTWNSTKTTPIIVHFACE